MRQFKVPISWIRDFTRFYEKTSFRILRRGLGTMVLILFWNISASAAEGLTLNVRGPSYLGLTRSISWLLMPWLLTSPGHSSHDIDYVEYAGPDLTWGRILRTCVISMWSNDIKYMFMLSLKNAARKGLVNHFHVDAAEYSTWTWLIQIIPCLLLRCPGSIRHQDISTLYDTHQTLKASHVFGW